MTQQAEQMEFNRSKVESLGNRVRITDKDDNGLELFCYVQCKPEDDITLHQCRGVVFKDDQLVMRAFPYTVEHPHNEMTLIERDIQPIMGKCKFFDSHEGTLIRIFNYADKWYVSTHRKLDAFRSKWSSRESFGQAFCNALKAEENANSIFSKELKDAKSTMSKDEDKDNILKCFQSTLDPKLQYMFLVRNSYDNRVVCKVPMRDTVYHVGTFLQDGTLDIECKTVCGIPRPKQHTFLNIDQLVDYVNKIDIAELQGIICFAPGNIQFKVIHSRYLDFFRARGNEPSIKYRYLQVRMNKKITDMLYYLYPDMEKTFDEIENMLYEIAKNIYTSYVQRFIKKRFLTVPTEEFAVIKECHKWHEQDREQNRINIDKIISVMNKQTPTALNKMIRRYKTEDKEETTVKHRNRSNTVEDNNREDSKNTMKSPLLLASNNSGENVKDIELGN